MWLDELFFGSHTTPHSMGIGRFYGFCMGVLGVSLGWAQLVEGEGGERGRNWAPTKLPSKLGLQVTLCFI